MNTHPAPRPTTTKPNAPALLLSAQAHKVVLHPLAESSRQVVLRCRCTAKVPSIQIHVAAVTAIAVAVIPRCAILNPHWTFILLLLLLLLPPLLLLWRLVFIVSCVLFLPRVLQLRCLLLPIVLSHIWHCTPSSSSSSSSSSSRCCSATKAAYLRTSSSSSTSISPPRVPSGLRWCC
jgi:hypothetical protein